MRITQEADYAFRIVRCLGSMKGLKMGSTQISEETVIPHRFTFKILRKLTQAGITGSIRGKGGGYKLVKEPADISLLEVLEVIDGPLLINRCLEDGYVCSMHKDDAVCEIHKTIGQVGNELRDKLSQRSFAEYIL